MAYGASVPNLSAFSTAELTALLTAAKSEILLRISGRVSSGSSSGQQFAMNQYSTDDLNRLVNALTSALGLDAQENRVRPNFSCGDNNGASAWGSTGVPNS